MQQVIETEVLTVSQLSQAIKQHLEGRFTHLSVQGEVSNFKEQASGHYYFTLKDAEAQISAVLFKGNARALTKIPKNGDQVIVKGEINVYLPRGNYQIIVRELKFSGVGALLLKLHEMKLLLQTRGWFDKAHKKPLPKYPKTIGVITSPTGSVIQDILHVLARRLKNFHLILNPVKVQGEGAAEEIARAIEQFNAHRLADLLIIGRGGGSLEDLWAFNEERVASAVFHSDIPIICAVGHETDYCIADFVADLRAPTPSAAAEIATTETCAELRFLFQMQSRLTHILRTEHVHSKKQLESFRRHPYLASPYLLLAPHIQRIDDLSSSLALSLKRFLEEKRLHQRTCEKQIRALSPKNQLAVALSRLHTCQRTLLSLLCHQLSAKRALIDPCSWRKKCTLFLLKTIQEKKERLLQLIRHLQGIDPHNLLKKGFCILFDQKSGMLLDSSASLQPQTQVRLLLHDGEAHLTVDKVIDCQLRKRRSQEP
jgi:exodeoxyribonuclease VII large subunit